MLRRLKRGILLFWALWFSVVVLTNVLDGLKAVHALPAGWTFASGNYELMLKIMAVHGTPAPVVAGLFVGVILWEGLATVLFWRGFRAWPGGIAGIDSAFIVGLALWAAFALADEIFLAYSIEAVHLRLFGLQLLSLLALRLLPDAPASSA